MADIVYFSGELTMSGEVKLAKHDVHVDYDAAPEMVAVPVSDALHSDPTLTVFYEPQSLNEDDEHALG